MARPIRRPTPRPPVAQWWLEEHRTMRLMAVIFGDGAGAVRYRGPTGRLRKRRFTYAEAAMFTYFMAMAEGA